MSTHEQATQEVRDAFDAVCRGRVEAAVNAEREACWRLCDALWLEDKDAHDCREAIRARGQA